MKIACIQMNSGADIAANIGSLTALVARAAEKGASFITTPENTFLMDEPGAARVAYTQNTHPGILAAAKLANTHGVWLLIGSVAIQDSGGQQADEPSAAPHVSASRRAAGATQKLLNRSLLFNPQGDVVAHYDKIHLFDVDVPGDRSYRESDRFAGGDALVLASLIPSPSGRGKGEDNATQEALTPEGLKNDIHMSFFNPSASSRWEREIKLGMTICYDVRFPHLYRALAKQGADIITVPAAFTQITGEAHWHVLLRARAIENGCFIVAPAQTGTHPGNRKTFGHSLIIDPWGRVLADGGTEVGIIMADLDLSEVEKTRAKLPSLAHDRDFG